MSPRTRDRSGRRGALKASEHLRAELERLGLNQIDVSKATGVTRQTINNVVNGRQPISRAMAAKLGRLTGRGSDYWLQDSFAALRRRLGVTTALVTHDIHEALLLATLVAVMRAGRIEQLASPAELVASPANDYVHTLLRRARVTEAVVAE